jgi:NhaB family Na+:H+ antiporter
MKNLGLLRILLFLRAIFKNFLGQVPNWYKITIISFLILNPFLFAIEKYILESHSFFITGWALVAEAIFTLMMALKCYPLPPFAILTIEAVALKLTTTDAIYHEVEQNLSVILLLIFAVAPIYFHKQIITYLFSKLLVKVRSKTMLSLVFLLISAVLSAFLNALTVTAVIITICLGFYKVYADYCGTRGRGHTIEYRLDGVKFRKFLRSILMHSVIGTALGGVATMVGEPQNLLIARAVDWDFVTFMTNMAKVTLPVIGSGVLVCILIEKFKLFGYGEELPESVYAIIEENIKHDCNPKDSKEKANLVIQGISIVLLILGLGFGVAEVGLVGLGIMGLITCFTGIIKEGEIGKSFEEAMPFTALLILFFAIISIIHQQHLFAPVIHWALSFQDTAQLFAFYIANATLSIISDNVFVATIYISEAVNAANMGIISREQLEALSITINTGTNISSIATPNGQAAFLFLLTSTITPLIDLSYGKMVKMALPYTIVLTGVGVTMACLF